ncbi:hypothetical protein PoB_006201400 [Plakobranchus ocellatus]|uniref:Uncharacterized protein n=1 Tax=Plakobranchus ocellatus TaxID=259542 RepID=A0AAV4CUC2_9GAST|nr:hypothetical protein PoB_006201400 [Plakobranchus ocellatus]
MQLRRSQWPESKAIQCSSGVHSGQQTWPFRAAQALTVARKHDYLVKIDEDKMLDTSNTREMEARGEDKMLDTSNTARNGGQG